MRITIKLGEDELIDVFQEHIAKRGCTYLSHRHTDYGIEIEALLDSKPTAAAPAPTPRLAPTEAPTPTPAPKAPKEEPKLNLSDLTRPTEEGVDEDIPKQNRPTEDNELTRLLLESQKLAEEMKK
jgi:hypothetical protein